MGPNEESAGCIVSSRSALASSPWYRRIGLAILTTCRNITICPEMRWLKVPSAELLILHNEKCNGCGCRIRDFDAAPRSKCERNDELLQANLTPQHGTPWIERRFEDAIHCMPPARYKSSESVTNQWCPKRLLNTAIAVVNSVESIGFAR
jgi:hypothetical protein